MVQWNEFQWYHQNQPIEDVFECANCRHKHKLLRAFNIKIIQKLKEIAVKHETWSIWWGLCSPKWFSFTRQYRISIYWFTIKWFVIWFGLSTCESLFHDIFIKIFVFAWNVRSIVPQKLCWWMEKKGIRFFHGNGYFCENHSELTWIQRFYRSILT